MIADAIVDEEAGERGHSEASPQSSDDSGQRETPIFGSTSAATNHDACGSCRGCAGSVGKVDEGLTCCELSGELFAELCGLGVTERETM